MDDNDIIMPETTERVLCFRADKPLEMRNYIVAEKKMEEMLARRGEIRMLLFFSCEPAWLEETTKSDMDLTLRYGPHITRFAVINPSEKLMFQFRMKKPIHQKAETRFYKKEEFQEALQWIDGP